MKKVILTVGTRGSGKSTFCEQVIACKPSIVEVSRDKILIELFGSTSLNPYEGGHYHAQHILWETIEEQLKVEESFIILDAWNGDGRDRRHFIQRLRDLGADEVVAWYFITPIEAVEEWFWKKPGIVKMSEFGKRTGKFSYYPDDAPRRDHEMFRRYAQGIDSEGFDEVVRINPLFAKPEDVLEYQASLTF